MHVDYLYIFTCVVFFIWALRSLLYWISQWQQFSTDRLSITSPFAYVFKAFFSPFSLISWLAIGFALFITITDLSVRFYELIVFFLFLLKAGVTLTHIYTKKIDFPSFTSQTIIVGSLATFITGLFVALPFTEKYLWLLILDRVLFFFVAIPLFFVHFPSEIIEDFQIRRASQVLKKKKIVKTIYVIGENASETAYFTYKLLQKEKNALLIDSSFIRPSMLATIILRDLLDETEYIFIVIPEHRLSMIESIALYFPAFRIIIPTSSPVECQRIFAQSFPLLAKHTKIFINQDLLHLINRRKSAVLSFSQKTTQLIERKDRLCFRLTIDSKDILLTFPLIGKSYLRYLLPAIYVAYEQGLSLDLIASSAHGLLPLPGRMVKHGLPSGLIVIDATQVVKKEEMKSCLEYLKFYTKEKVVIFAIENQLSHKEILELKPQLSLCSQLFIFDQKLQKVMRKALELGTGKSVLHYANDAQICTYVSSMLGKGDTVLILGSRGVPVLEKILLS